MSGKDNLGISSEEPFITFAMRDAMSGNLESGVSSTIPEEGQEGATMRQLLFTPLLLPALLLLAAAAASIHIHTVRRLQ